jgi:transposase-like protein
MRALRKYSEEYKLTVVREIERCGSVTAVERAIGIQRSLLYRWYKELRGSAWGSGDRGDTGRDGAAASVGVVHG